MSNDDNSNKTVIDQWMDLLQEGLFEISKPKTNKEPQNVEDVSYHDFGSYAFVLDPWANRKDKIDSDWVYEVVPSSDGDDAEPLPETLLEFLSQEAAWTIEAFISDARQASADPDKFDDSAIRIVIERFICVAMRGILQRQEPGLINLYGIEGMRFRRDEMLIYFLEAEDNGLADVVDWYERMNENQRGRFFEKFDIAVAQWAQRSAQFDRPWTCHADLLPKVTMHQWGSTVVAYDLKAKWTWKAAGYQERNVFQSSQYITKSPNEYDYNNPDAMLIMTKERSERAHEIAWRSSVYDDKPYPQSIGSDDYDVPFPASHPFHSIEDKITRGHCEVAFAYAGELRPSGSSAHYCELISEIADRILSEEPPSHEQETEEIVAWLDNILNRLSGSLVYQEREPSVAASAGISIGSIDLSASAEASAAAGVAPTGRYDRYELAYGFRPYQFPSINLGLQVVYRQEWDRQQIAKGDLVKTIPLGPGQSEKIVLKQLERDRVTRKLEEVEKYERATESSLKTTDSSEVVVEAARSSKWNMNIDFSAEASGKTDFLVAGGSFNTKLETQTAYETNSSTNSRNAKKKLAEAMQRASSKLNRERRVTVNTEREVVQEETRTSEIKNTNDTMAVTYYYYTLQQQYQVYTFLASVEPVLFVAEKLPDPDALTIEWVRRYDWILRGVLLDDSFAEVLSELRTLDVEEVRKEVEDAREKVRTLSNALSLATTASLNDVQTSSSSVELANTYEGILRAYLDSTREARELAREYQAILSQARRLGMHLGDNILHYCRAIWSTEDPERRRLRYAEQTWPTQFTVEEPLGPLEDDSDPDGQWLWGGRFEPKPASELPLAQLIDPTGPLGFAGNYAVFRMPRTSVTAGFAPLIRLVAQPYFTEQTFSVSSQIAAVKLTNRDLYLGGSYVVTRTGDDKKNATSYAVSRVFLEDEEALTDAEVEVIFAQEDEEALTDAEVEVIFAQEDVVPVMTIKLPIDGVEFLFRAFPAKGDDVRIEADEVQLQDPEILYLQQLHPELPLEAGPGSGDVETSGDTQPGNGDKPKSIMDALRRANTRDVLVDTQNLHLEIDPSPLLEPFKQYHRMLDVAMVAVEVERRRKRLAAGMYDDPDVDKQINIRRTVGDLDDRDH